MYALASEEGRLRTGGVRDGGVSGRGCVRGLLGGLGRVGLEARKGSRDLAEDGEVRREGCESESGGGGSLAESEAGGGGEGAG